jgi:nuclear RNA export factor
LQSVLSRRYSFDTKVLNLTNLCAEPEITQMGGVATLYDHPKLIKALCALCEDAFKTPEERAAGVTGIQLGGNALGSLNIIKPIVWTFPELINLDLSGNNIQRIEQLVAVRRFDKLQHIILNGNPIEQNNAQLRPSLIRWYPQLKIIDTIAVTDVEIAEAKNLTKEMPLKVTPGMWLDDSGIGENLIKEFFVRFDGDRQNMHNMFYDETSQFSLAVNTNSLREPGVEASNQRGEWKEWIRESRNLLRLDFLGARKSRLHTGKHIITIHEHELTSVSGVQEIGRTFQNLPATRHPPVEETSKWLFEALPLQGVPDPNTQSSVNGLIITVHGELLEHPNDPSKRKLRSFDRTFTLGPNKMGGVRIINDQLVLRNYGGTKAFPQNQGVQATQEQGEQAMVSELMRVTGMNAAYAKLCLEQQQWKYERALESFQSVRAQIPPEAFVH